MRAMPTILPLRLHGVGFDAGGRTLLDGVDLTIGGTAPTLILGHNGAGKSLLLRLCHGLLTPSRGRVEWQGPGAAQARRQPFRHAMVFQRPVMLRRSALGNLTHALAVAGHGGLFTGRRGRAEAARAVLERFGLAHLASRPARVLSGGEQQRLALARAWALEPEVLFLDEPAAALDPAATRAVETMLHGFTEAGIKVVMTTHDLGQARRLAGDVVFLAHGRVVEHAPAQRFFQSPRSPQAAAFLRGDLFS